MPCPGFSGWQLNHFPGQPVPMLGNPFSEVKFPNIQSKPPLAQPEAISSCPITCYLGEETDPHLSTTSFQAKQPQFPQLLLIRLVLQTLHQLHCPSLDTLQHLNVSLVVGGPKLNTVFEVRPHQGRVQGHDHFPAPAGHAIFDTSQDAIGFLGHLGTLLAHIQPAVNQHRQVLLCQAAFQPLFPKPVALHGVAVAQVQDLALGLVKPHTIDLGPLIQPVQVPLQSLPPLKQINTPTQLGVICKLTEGALDPLVQIIDKDIKQNWPQHRALGNTACDRPPTGVNSIHHHSLGPAIQPVLYPVKNTPVQAMSSQFLQENAYPPVILKFKSLHEKENFSLRVCTVLSAYFPTSLYYFMSFKMEAQVKGQTETLARYSLGKTLCLDLTGVLLDSLIAKQAKNDMHLSGIVKDCASAACLPDSESLLPLVTYMDNVHGPGLPREGILEREHQGAPSQPNRTSSCRVSRRRELGVVGISGPVSIHMFPGTPHVGAAQDREEELEGWRLNHFPGQPLPMLGNPFSEVKFPNIQSKPPLAQLEAISSRPITCYLGEETNPHLSTTSFQAKQPQFPQPLLIRLLLQTLHQLRCLSLDTLQHLNVSLVVRGPKLNTVFEVRPHQCRVQGHDHFPTPAGHAIFDTSQDAIGFLGHLGTLLAHIQPGVNQHPQVLLCQAAFQPLFPKPVALHGVAVAQSLPPLKQINTPTQLGVICKLTESALDPLVQIIDKDIKQNRPQHRALGNTACKWRPTGINSIHHHSLGPAVQPVLYPAKSTPVQAMSSQFLQENAVGNRVKGFTEVQIDNIHSLSLIH
ncbi:hypothetical protein QYF61_022020 [Mycteria americana]|uniref:Uncharacterized protein n=1 Tax=Mycteria americana TaxID=33587 RepID=A0AAN7RZU3_MYCAM|nr:hypothetical protein QYF61_022020 [Mycteria americana]